MPAIGITGGVSTGKTTFCDCLRELVPAAKFFDADQAARELVDLDPEVQKKLALEQILHPRIRRQWSAQAKTSSSQFFFADIPLLYETGGETLCDRVVVVASSPHIQLKRLLERKRIDSSAAEEMIKSQMPLTEKISRADHVVWNNDGRFVLKEQAKLLVDLWREESWTKI